MFDTILVVDWSAANDRGPAPKRDAIWTAVARGPDVEDPLYHRNRQVAEAWISDFLDAERAAGRRVLAGFDFPFGFPTGTARAVTGQDDPLALWDWIEATLEDSPRANTRVAVAEAINRAFPGRGPFWFHPGGAGTPDLPHRQAEREGAFGVSDHRAAEAAAPGAFSIWQLGGAGSVGGQAITGMATLARLRRRLGPACAVWPFEPPEAQVVLAEVFPSLLRDQVRAATAEDEGAIRDAVQVRLLARALAALSAGGALSGLLRAPDAPADEGWILGAGAEDRLIGAALPQVMPPRLKDDCFALPPGVDWVPVDAALAHLRAALSVQVGTETRALGQAAGAILARDAMALRANPPLPNAAVDGYGFAHGASGDGVNRLPLVDGRAAAGAPYAGTVPMGHAIRILTGASLPDGVDTVVLDEDSTAAEGVVAFHGPVKPRANTRRAGEDVMAGDIAVAAGTRLRPPELAILSATGVGAVEVYRPLTVGVLSTGDELTEPGGTPGPGGIFDANRPMLLALARGWGHVARDLGIASDDRDAVRRALDEGAAACGAILTSGGASAGDEDHISAILRAEGQVTDWRIALKPGRPLMLGTWKGVPVFGMPGNPVAALVCAVIFARPALSVLAGGGWLEPPRLTVPAAFSKRKKAGRREFLRARLDADGRAEVFASEGSGRISGLAWATGLVELDDGARDIAPGDPVRFLPYAMLGMT